MIGRICCDTAIQYATNLVFEQVLYSSSNYMVVADKTLEENIICTLDIFSKL
jgi:hypothetical protein